MRLFEFEAKAILKGYGIPVPSGKIAYSAEEVHIERPSVLKAQILAGGRKKAGGVAFVIDQKEAREEASRIFGAPLRGYPVRGLLIEDQIPIDREFFLPSPTIQLPRQPSSFSVRKGESISKN